MSTIYLKFWGTRGSCPVSGSEYAQFGGDTSCLELRNNEDIIIFDTGTGCRRLGEQLINESSRTIHLFISHFHWDHILGFPFFQPIYEKGFNLHIYAPGDEKSIRENFSLILNSRFFPISFAGLPSRITFNTLSSNKPIEIGDIKIYSSHAAHPGEMCLFKIRTPSQTFGYATDNEFLCGNQISPEEINLSDKIYEPYLEQIEFFEDCDFMVHESQYLSEEYPEKIGWGHSSTENAALLMKIIKAKEWMVTHHDPNDTDTLLLDKQKKLQQIMGDSCKVAIVGDGFVKNLSSTLIHKL